MWLTEHWTLLYVGIIPWTCFSIHLAYCLDYLTEYLLRNFHFVTSSDSDIKLCRHDWLKCFLAVEVKQFTNLINTSFSQDRIQIRLTLALWQWHIYYCLLFIYLFIYLLLNAAQRENLSPSEPKISVTRWQVFVTEWHLCHPFVELKDALLFKLTRSSADADKLARRG